MKSLKYGFPFVFSLNLLVACHSNDVKSHLNGYSDIKDTVTMLVKNIEREISAGGPIVWLNYFEDTPSFFMATDGQLAFKDYQSAKIFIQQTLVKSLPKIYLHWENIRIEPLSSSTASIGMNFHEDLTGNDGHITSLDGYFTAVTDRTSKGWKLRNVHWSILKTK